MIIPAENEPDLEEIDQTVRRALNFVTADHIDNVLDIALDFSSAKLIAKTDEKICTIIGESNERVESCSAIRQ